VQTAVVHQCKLLLYISANCYCTSVQTAVCKSVQTAVVHQYKLLLYISTSCCCTSVQTAVVHQYKLLLYISANCCSTWVKTAVVHECKLLLYNSAKLQIVKESHIKQVQYYKADWWINSQYTSLCKTTLRNFSILQYEYTSWYCILCNMFNVHISAPAICHLQIVTNLCFG
jgi:hypothetical protein